MNRSGIENKDLSGLVTMKDIEKSAQYPNATKDSSGRLRVAAALGTGEDTLERAEQDFGVPKEVITAILGVETNFGSNKLKFNKLGNSELQVSSFCLWSMTWGEATSENDGHWQLDFSLDNGINFVDTAEMYPTNPLRKETAGDTEKIIGNWLRKRKKTIGFKILITIENRDMPKTLAAVNSPESESSPKVKTDDTTQHRANISQNLPTIIKAK